ncbi:WhiB family transcriptional regulator [Haloactinomyces albus]|uniref:Transcriptional regulator WhiB n=1 Tax=Haloactinomyces albus TaxID=1352928 RepID=A0AAE4CPA4_9ACTN|nr:WhiB family transcriptional regulator [Haloactinomyces albus]MDR7302907.1 WhiB family redox-sensing transcriptional regulator [Haloactinomyces albus]
MSAPSVPVSTEDGTEECGAAVAALLDSTPSEEPVLPCRRDPDLWFAESPGELEKAKNLCTDCPVKQECLAGALSRGEPWGVWGGEILDRGAVVARKRPRGRPRKSTSARATDARTARGEQEQAA